jgi:hypothetical protein
MLRIYRSTNDPRTQKTLLIFISCLVFLSWSRMTTGRYFPFLSTINSSSSSGSNKQDGSSQLSAILGGNKNSAISNDNNDDEPNLPETFVPANKYVGSKLTKPLEIKGNNGGIWCPEKGGGTKNLACSKTSTEYRFQVKKEGKYYLYVQTIAPTIMDNSLWIGRVDVSPGSKEYDAFYECSSSTTAGPLIPHKHVSSKKTYLCCPAYLAKNEKKGMNPFYSACTFTGLGPNGDEHGIAFDLELSEAPRWNQVPRIILVEKANIDKVISIRIYAREDGTQWTGLFLSKKSALTTEDLP